MLSLNVKESENIIPGSIPLSEYAPKVKRVLFWAETHPRSKFQGNTFSSFFVNPGNKPTTKKTQKRTLFDGGKAFNLLLTVKLTYYYV